MNQYCGYKDGIIYEADFDEDTDIYTVNDAVEWLHEKYQKQFNRVKKVKVSLVKKSHQMWESLIKYGKSEIKDFIELNQTSSRNPYIEQQGGAR